MLKAGTIDDRDVPSLILNQAGSLQRTRRRGHARSLYPQHHGKEFLREQKFIRLHSVG